MAAGVKALAHLHQRPVGQRGKPAAGQEYACRNSTTDFCSHTPRFVDITERKMLWNLPLFQPFSSMPISWGSQDPAFSCMAHPPLFFQTGAIFLFPVKSQNSLGWKGTLKVIWSRHLLKAELTSQLDQAVQGYVQLSSEHLQGWQSPTLSGQPVPAFAQPHEEIFPNS